MLIPRSVGGLYLVLLLNLGGWTAAQQPGTWSAWSAWSPCSQSCGTGLIMRNRTCTLVNAPDALDCDGSATESLSCITVACPIDPTWAAWSAWSGCSVSCGSGASTRQRTCVPSGASCPGNATDATSCQAQACPETYAWGTWSSWSACSKNCDGGIQTHFRSCLRGAGDKVSADLCSSGLAEETMSCGSTPCAVAGVDGGWSEWSPFGQCSATCDLGTYSRFRSCSNPAPANGGKNCTGDGQQDSACQVAYCPVDGAWGFWMEWGDCSVTCNSGVQRRSRSCNFPAPAYGGRDCTGQRDDQRTCSINACPRIDGVWSEWAFDGKCSTTCGGGQQVRRRLCNSPAPANGGWACGTDGALEDVQYIGCNFNNCPVHGGWSPWSVFSACSTTCSSGLTSRQRSCNQPAPDFGGRPCLGVDTETQQCVNSKPCAVDGGWSDWADWSSCVPRCAGQQARRRLCNRPSPDFGGLNCTGSADDIRSCNDVNCNATGTWTSWSSWSNCLLKSLVATCGSGFRVRSRDCANADYCPGVATDALSCSIPCPTIPTTPQPSSWTQWAAWGTCTKTCAGGSRTRTRQCQKTGLDAGCDATRADIASEIENCNQQLCPVDGAWSEWQAFSSCSVSCGAGSMSRRRVCDNPRAAYGGKACDELSLYDFETEVRDCTTAPCGAPVNATTTTTTTTTIATTTTPVNGSNITGCFAGLSKNIYWPAALPGDVVSSPCPNSTVNATRSCSSSGWDNADTVLCTSFAFMSIVQSSVDVTDTKALKSYVSQLRTTCRSDQFQFDGDVMTCTQQALKVATSRPLLSSSLNDTVAQAIFTDSMAVLESLLGSKDFWTGLKDKKSDESRPLVLNVINSIATMMNDWGHRVVAGGSSKRRKRDTAPVNIYTISDSLLDGTVDNVNLCQNEFTYYYPVMPVESNTPASARKKTTVQKITRFRFTVKNATNSSCGGVVSVTSIIFKDMQSLLPNYLSTVDTFIVNGKLIYFSVTPVNSVILSRMQPYEFDLWMDKVSVNFKCAEVLDDAALSVYKFGSVSASTTAKDHVICGTKKSSGFFTVLAVPDDSVAIVVDTSIPLPRTVGGAVLIAIQLLLLIIFVALGLSDYDWFFHTGNLFFASSAGTLIYLLQGYALTLPGACAFMGAFQQYFALVTVFWGLILVIFAHRQVLLVSYEDVSKRWQYMLFCWGTPLIIVGISLTVVYDYYGIGKYCWIDTDKLAILAYFGPASLVHLIAIIVGLVGLLRVKSDLPTVSSTRYLLVTALVMSTCHYTSWLTAFFNYFIPMVGIDFIYMSLNVAISILDFMLFCVFDDATRDTLRAKFAPKRVHPSGGEEKKKVVHRVPEWARGDVGAGNVHKTNELSSPPDTGPQKYTTISGATPS